MLLQNDRLIKVTGSITILFSVLFIFLKSYIFIVTQSLSVQASLFDSILDGLTSAVNMVALVLAAKPADNDHRFGHGKIEALAGFTQSLLILSSSVYLLYSMIQNFFSPTPIVDTGAGIGGMIFITSMTFGLVVLQRYTVYRTNSLLIKIDSLHYETDLFLNIGVLINLSLSLYLNLLYLDIIIGSIIAVYILTASFQMLRTSANILLDREISHNMQLLVKNIIYNDSHVLGLKNLRTRSCGQHQFIEATIELAPQINSKEMARECYKIREKIIKQIPTADVVIQIYHSE